jgi:hypothetical protein
VTTIFLGGSSDESANGAVFHLGTGEVFVTGETTSTDFPAAGGAQSTFGGSPGSSDAFVARFPPDLSTLNQGTYLGGSGVNSGLESGRSLAVNSSSGEVYLTGETDSYDFPGTAGGADSSLSYFDAFVARFDHTLTASPCNDNDGDGFNAEGGICGPADCDDGNGAIYPGASEICDNEDNDCNDLIDDGDPDGDGIFVCDDACPEENATGFDADENGCIDSPLEMINVVNTLLGEGIIDGNVAKEIVNRLEAVMRPTDKDNICAAVNKLEALINTLMAQGRNGNLPAQSGDWLTEYTQSVIAYLISQLPTGESCPGF